MSISSDSEPVLIESINTITIQGLPESTDFSLISHEDDIPDGPVGDAVASVRARALQAYMEDGIILMPDDVRIDLTQLPSS